MAVMCQHGNRYPNHTEKAGNDMEIRTYKVTDYDMAMRKKKAVNGVMNIEFHNGIRWYVVKWYESEE